MYISDDDYQNLEQELQQAEESWSGELVKHLSISIGYVPLSEDPSRTIDEIVQLAETRMYEAKSEYYRTSGFDRRKV